MSSIVKYSLKLKWRQYWCNSRIDSTKVHQSNFSSIKNSYKIIKKKNADTDNKNNTEVSVLVFENQNTKYQSGKYTDTWQV